MSNVIDNRVVEMRFDNGQFEKGVQQSLSTLDKLKQALDFSKFGDIGSKINFNSVSGAITTAGEKFSAFEAIAVGALMKIGAQAVELGEKLVKSLSIDQISAGWEKYGEMTSNVATIMAATGDDIDVVSAQMEKLLYFTDETSYNFTDMANNIGKFTANGIGLDSATQAMEGIATWAAKSGQNAGTASRAMYNLAQAIGMGALKLQDWKSVELANMGTKEFKEQAIQAGLAVGTLTKGIDGVAKTAKGTKVEINNFRETLQEGWLDTNALMETLNGYGKAAELISDIHDATGLYAADMMDLVDKQKAGELTTRDLANALGLQGDQSSEAKVAVDALGDSIRKLASDEYAFSLEAYKAGQEARTFKDAIDATKDAVSSGWMQTFQLIFGQYDEAKKLWSDVAEGLYDIFTNGRDARNELLKDWGSSNWDKLKDEIGDTGASVDTFTKNVEKYLREAYQSDDVDKIIKKYGSINEAIKQGAFDSKELANAVKASISDIISGSGGLESAEEKLKSIQQTVKDVWSGALGNGEERKAAVEALGFDYDTIQKLVDKGAEYEIKLEDLTEEELKAIGLGEKEIEQLKAIQGDYDSLLKIAGQGGREMLAEGIVNALTDINDLLTLVKDTWAQFFGSITSEGLLNVTKNFRDLTESLKLYNEETGELTSTGEKVHNILNKIFSAAQNVVKIFQNVGRIVGDFVKSLAPAADAAKTLANSLYELFMSVTGRLGDFLETVDLTDQFGKVSSLAAEAITFLAGKVDELRVRFEKWKPGDSLGKLGEVLQGAKQKISDFFKTTEDGVTPFQKIVNMFDTLAEKAKNIKNVFQPLKDFFKDFWSGLKDALDLNGVTNVFDGIARVFKNIYEAFKKILSNFTIGDMLKAAAGYIGVQLLRLAKVIPDIGKGITWVIDQFYGVTKSLKGILKNFQSGGFLKGAFGSGGLMGALFPGMNGSNLSPLVRNIKAVAESILMLGGGVLMLAAALAILAAIKPEKLVVALAAMVATLGAVGGVVVGLTTLMKALKINPAELIAVAAAIAVVSAALLVLAAALAAFSLVAKMDTMWEGFIAMAASLVVVAAALGMLAKQELGLQMIAVAAAIAIVAASLLVLAAALAAFSAVVMMNTWQTGLLAMVATLAAVAVALGVLEEHCNPVKLLAAAAAIAVVSASLLIMAAALGAFTLIANQGIAAAAGLLAMVAVLAALTAALIILSALGPSILIGAAALVAASVAVVAIAAGLAAAAVAVAALGVAVAALITAVGISVGVAIAAVATGISVAVITVAAAVTAVVAAVAASIALLAAGIGSAISSIATGIATAVTAIGVAIGTIATVISAGVGNAISAIGTGLGTAISALAQGLGTAIDAIGTGIGGAISGLGEGIGGSIAAVGTGIGKAFEEVGNGIAKGISAISQSIGSFGDSIASIGQGIESFGGSVKTLGLIDLVTIGHGLVELAKGLKEINKNPFKGDASQVQAYAQALQNLSQVTTQITTLGETLKTTMSTLGTEMSQNLANGIQNGISQVGAAATTIVNNLKVSFDGAVAESTRSGAAIGIEFVRGIQNGISGAASAGQQLAQAAVQAVQSSVGQFTQIGYQFSNGLAQGIRNGSSIVSSAVQSVVNQAVNAARSAAQVHSPSRVFAKIGEYFSLGMAKGIDEGAREVAKSTDALVNDAVDGVANAMSKIVDTLNTDVDMDPVITPVLDLSNIQNNSKKLNQMLSKNKMTIDAVSDISMNHNAMQQAAIDQQNRGVTASIDPALAAALMNQANSGPVDVKINFNGSLAQLAAVLQPAIVAETNRIGKSLINA